MGIELVKRISLKGEKIMINSACSNVSPKTYETWEYKGTVKNVIDGIIGNSLSIYSGTDGKFMNYFSMNLLKVSKRFYKGNVHECYRGLSKKVWYRREYDKSTQEPTPKDLEAYETFIKEVETSIKNKEVVCKEECFLIDENGGYIVKPPNRNGSYKYRYKPYKISLSKAIISSTILRDTKIKLNID